MRRRVFTTAALSPLALLASPSALALPRKTLQFPQDHGAHPELRTEWWYLTGALQAGARAFGFQLTFFRTRVDGTQGLASAFAAKQLVFAHAAVTDGQGGKLWHSQSIARQGFGIAHAAQGDTAVRLRDWSLLRTDAHGQALYALRMQTADFALELQCRSTQALLLQGDAGLSRKGPSEQQASYYYSQPQLQTQGRIRLQGQNFAVTGTAWLDHEWSEEMLHPQAEGWDWIGMNLLDGSALTAFRLRQKPPAMPANIALVATKNIAANANDGAHNSSLWSGGSWRNAAGQRMAFGPNEVVFTPLRTWASPLSQARYPVEWQVQTPAGSYTVKAVLDAQELDSRNSTGSLYWEGLSELFDSAGKKIGQGYLEMTGYASPLRL